MSPQPDPIFSLVGMLGFCCQGFLLEQLWVSGLNYFRVCSFPKLRCCSMFTYNYYGCTLQMFWVSGDLISQTAQPELK